MKGRCLNRLTMEPSLLPPRAGLEPATTRLTAECSTIELSRIISFPLHPQNCILPHPFSFSLFLGQALDRLVTVSSTCCHASTPALSTSSSSRGLTSFRYGISHLEGGFTLRCLQRLSLPNLATRLWLWSPTGIPAVRPSRSSRTKDGSP